MSARFSDRTLVKLAWYAFGFVALLFVGGVFFSFVNASSMTTTSWGSPGVIPGLLFLLVTFAFPLVGVLVASRQPKNAVGWVLLAVGFAWGFSSLMDNYVGYAVLTNPGALPRPDVVEAVAAGAFVPAIGFTGMLVLLFPDGHLPSPRWRAIAWVVGSAMVIAWIGATLAPGTFEDTGYPHMTNPLGIESLQWLSIFVFVVPVGFLVSAVGLIKKFRRSRGQERAQMKWFAAGATATAVIALIVVLGTYGRPITGWVQWAQDLDLFSFVLIPVATGVAILKYRLYEIDRIINRALVYTILTAVLGAIYLLVVVGLDAALSPVTKSSDLAVAASTLAVAGLFGPLRRRLQFFIDRRFYRQRFDAAKTVERFSSHLKDEIDLDELSSSLAGVINEAMQPARVSVWLRDQTKVGAEALADIAPNDPVVAYFQSASGAVDVDSLDLDSPAVASFKEAGVKLVVPLVSQGELIGLLNLGPRLSEREYSGDDRRLLDSLGAQAAPAVRVGQLVQEQQAQVRTRERLEQEMRVAQLIQQQFLPKELPELSGWHVSAFYRPARAVGGDFYDFIDLPDGRVAIVAGDVTDKGVPAALVMATTRSILRSEAVRLVSPSQVLEKANDLLFPDIPAHMFVTCLYAVLEPETGKLTFANAGHNLPYVRGSKGVKELKARGMPLGLMPGMSYEEVEAVLDPSEVMLLHSDGLAEAHDSSGNMFGFGRMHELMAQRESADDIIDLLLAELDRFSGPSHEQEDDITLVALQRSSHGGMAEERSPATAAATNGSGKPRVLEEFSLPSASGNERAVMDRVVAAIGSVQLPAARLEQLKTAVSEAAMNAIEHGNESRAELPVEVTVAISNKALHVSITDHGGGRDIPAVETPDLEAKLAGLQKPRGWGLFLIENMVDAMNVTSDETHHTIELILDLEGA
ncbi:MAG: SpoIIE family protein phosphatase [Actinomycetota bacterium]